jgi:hypothetical protein
MININKCVIYHTLMAQLITLVLISIIYMKKRKHIINAGINE